MIVDVIAPHSPAVDIALRDGLHGLAKAAPVKALAVTTQSALIQLLLQVDIGLQVMLLDQVVLKALPPIANLGTSRVFARPRFETKVLAALMSFPVILAPELFSAVSPCTAVGLLVAFHVFP